MNVSVRNLATALDEVNPTSLPPSLKMDDAIPRIPDLDVTNLEFLLSVPNAAKDAAAKILDKVKQHRGSPTLPP